jgi:hypothetical protein
VATAIASSSFLQFSASCDRVGIVRKVLEVEHKGVATVLSGLLDEVLFGSHNVSLDGNALGLLGITLELDGHSPGLLNVVLLGLLDVSLGGILPGLLDGVLLGALDGGQSLCQLIKFSPVLMMIAMGREILFPSQDRVALNARWACKWR